MPEEIKPATKPRAAELIDRYEQLLSGRKNFESYWQSLHDYFGIRPLSNQRMSLHQGL